MSLGLNPRQALAAARFWAIEKAPYFSHAILSLQPFEVPNGTLSPIGTFGVTARGVLYYEVQALERWSTPEAGTVLIHEVLHWIRDHAGRCATLAADPKLFNLAGDYEINDDLLAMQLPLPDGGGMQPARDGFPINRTAEEYYQLLQQQAQQGKGGDGKDPGFGQTCSCGSASGHAHPAEPDDGGKGAGDEQDEDGGGVDRPRGHDVDVLEAIRQATATAVSDAVTRGVGNIPRGVARWAEERLTPPKVPWTTKLARAGRGAVAYRPGATDYSFNRVSRRQGGLGFGPGRPVAPAMVTRVPNVAVAVDTSGSMGASELERALIESTAIMRAIGAEIQFVACDCKVHAIERVRSPKQLQASFKGGGGTSFVPVFHALEELRPRPEVMIFITDGGGDAPRVAPKGTHVIWLLVGSHRMRPFYKGNAINWGEFIEVDE